MDPKAPRYPDKRGFDKPRNTPATKESDLNGRRAISAALREGLKRAQEEEGR